MSSISSIGLRTSPLERLQSLLQQDVSSGSVSETDATAVSSALESIDKEIRGSAPPPGGAKGGPPPGPPPSGGTNPMKEKVESLIQQQVDSGALTSDQATELKSLFEKMRPGSDKTADAADNPTSTSSTSSGDALKLLQDFLDTLRSSSTGRYGGTGTGATVVLEPMAGRHAGLTARRKAALPAPRWRPARHGPRMGS